jgi:hypothetical protein
MKKIIFNTRLLLLICVVMSLGLGTSCKNDEPASAGSKVELLSFGPTGSQIGDTISFIGKNLNLVTKIQFAGDSVLKASFISQSSLLIKVIVPNYVTKGYVKLIAAKDTIVSKTMFDLLVTVTITSFNDSIRPGDNLTITGQYVNWITEVWFSKNLVVRDSNFVSKSLNQIVIKVPKNAQTGPLVINTAGTKPLSITPDKVLKVILPSISSFDPIPVARGGNLTILGTNLDLTMGVLFNGVADTVKTFVSQTANQLVVTVPLTTAKGPLTLVSFSNLPVVSTTIIKLVGDLPDLGYALYDDAIMNGWADNGWNNTPDYSNTEQIRDGAYSLKATFTKIKGGVDFYNPTGVSTANYTVFTFSAYGGPGTNGYTILVKANLKTPGYNAIIQEGKWVDFTIPLTTLGSPKTLTDLLLQNTFAKGVIYFDHVGLQ